MASDDKRQFCEAQGASVFFDYADARLEENVQALISGHGAHAVVMCARSEAGYNQAVRLLRRSGTLVCVGLPSNLDYTLPLSPMSLVNRGLFVIGSSVGTEAEMQELLQMGVRGDIVPQVQVLLLEDFQGAIEAPKTSRTSGRVVLRIP